MYRQYIELEDFWDFPFDYNNIDLKENWNEAFDWGEPIAVPAQPPEMFSEEYQVEFLMRYIELLDKKPYIVGHHVWNLYDFKTAQGIRRMCGINYKSVFTRDRRPKMAAHQLKKLWRKNE